MKMNNFRYKWKSALFRVVTISLILGLAGFSSISSENKPADKNIRKVALKDGSKVDVEKPKQNSNNYLLEATKFDLIKLMKHDPAVAVLVFLSILALAVAAERTIVIIKNKGNNARLIETIKHSIVENPDNVKKLIQMSEGKEYGFEGRVAAKTLRGWNFGITSMQEFGHAAHEVEKRLLEKRLVVLSTLGNNAPFIGLLGTVLGIIKAFAALGQMGDAGPAVVMVGISQALWATAAGLVVAIPSVILYNIFAKKVKAILSNSDEIISIICGLRVAVEKNPDALKSLTEDVHGAEDELTSAHKERADVQLNVEGTMAQA